MEGNIHSIETFGTLDGPGIRYVVFFKGCPTRCLYCHNPDTWDISGGEQKSADWIVDDYERYQPFFKNGGMTATGGEPLMQIDFLIELFEKAKAKNIHTCLDTSGVVFDQNNVGLTQKFERLLQVTDLIMLDIKHIIPKEHFKLTQCNLTNVLDFAKFIDERNVDIWIRHVIVEGITFVNEYLEQLGHYIGGLKNVKALDVIPYHNMAETKYEQLGMDYPLKGMKPLTNDDAIKARNIILDVAKRRRREDL